VIVVDASAVVDILLRVLTADTAAYRLFHSGETLHAPHLLDLEVAQALRRHEATRQAEPARCREALDDLACVRLFRYPHNVLLPRVWELRNNLTAYDAAYVALAEMLSAPLLTRDQRLAASAGHRARIELV
jgi:predicted nucleic acid-binding protein